VHERYIYAASASQILLVKKRSRSLAGHLWPDDCFKTLKTVSKEALDRGGGGGCANGKKIARGPNSQPLTLVSNFSRASFKAPRAIFGPRAVI